MLLLSGRSMLSIMALLAVFPSAQRRARAVSSVGQTRIYYIAADEVMWDYVPGGRDEIAGRPYADSAFFASGPPRPVSTVYKKVLYREYTDSTFRTLKPRPAEWEHLGFLGPIIHAVVGDTIRVVFRNNGHEPFS
ncbi:MAG: multicopper oxidase domain-containing protein, partial [Gemmatimonadaceae bacterium]